MLPAAISVEVCAWYDRRYELLADQRRFSELLIKHANKATQVDTTDCAGGCGRRRYDVAARRGSGVAFLRQGAEARPSTQWVGAHRRKQNKPGSRYWSEAGPTTSRYRSYG